MNKLLLIIFAVVLVGCEPRSGAGSVITYQFDETVPYNEWEKAAAKEAVSTTLDTNYTDDGGCVVTFMYHEALMTKWKDQIELNDAMAVSHWNTQSGKCGIDFSMKHFDSDDIEKFKGVLIHEVAHLWGLHHSSNRKSIMFPEYYSYQVLLPEDLIQLNREKANGKFR